MAGGALASYLYGLARYGIGPQASTCAFMSLTLGQLLHALGCRAPQRSLLDGLPPQSNGYLSVGLGACVGLQLLALTLPPLRTLLHLAPLGALDALVVGAGAGVPFLLNEMGKPRQAAHQDDALVAARVSA
jgi:Ca2+-transporting ATPase